jgi:hypothetical protein
VEKRERISGLMIEMAFYLSAFGLFTTGRIVRMMKKTVKEEIREKFHCHFFYGSSGRERCSNGCRKDVMGEIKLREVD